MTGKSLEEPPAVGSASLSQYFWIWGLSNVTTSPLSASISVIKVNALLWSFALSALYRSIVGTCQPWVFDTAALERLNCAGKRRTLNCPASQNEMAPSASPKPTENTASFPFLLDSLNTSEKFSHNS